MIWALVCSTEQHKRHMELSLNTERPLARYPVDSEMMINVMKRSDDSATDLHIGDTDMLPDCRASIPVFKTIPVKSTCEALSPSTQSHMLYCVIIIDWPYPQFWPLSSVNLAASALKAG